jgi:DNA-binding NtrC family response regulator
MPSDATVLFVDDERPLLHAIRRHLVHESYSQVFADEAQEALAILMDRPVQVVVADMRMPGMDGLSLLRIVKTRWPDTIRIALSAYTMVPQLLAAINNGEVYRYLPKPMRHPDEIVGVIRQALEHHRLLRERQELLERMARRNRELEEMLATRRRLEGLLPICSGCRCIRDERGEWRPIEGYIREHSGAAVHSVVCPECASGQRLGAACTMIGEGNG